MIRCIPVDGSAPFEVESGTLARRTRRGGYPYGKLIAACDLACAWFEDRRRVAVVRDQLVSIESWRERAERLEKELAGLRHRIALDAMDKRRESERG